MVGITYPHWIGTTQKVVEIKVTNNPYKAGSQDGVFSSRFFKKYEVIYRGFCQPVHDMDGAYWRWVTFFILLTQQQT